MAEIENPRIRPVGDLLQENFFVPRYQRGYRWGKQEITELLDDILQYYQDSKPSSTEKKAGKFYSETERHHIIQDYLSSECTKTEISRSAKS